MSPILQAALRFIVEHKGGEQISHRLPYIGIDECLNHPMILQLGKKLVEQELADSYQTLWYQGRQRTDGSRFILSGSDTTFPSGHTIPIKHWSWSDEEVVAMLLTLFDSADRVVLLSGNTRRNQDGLRQILQKDIAPVLETHHGGKLSLLAIFKKGKTAISRFATEVQATLTSCTFTPGFVEILI